MNIIRNTAIWILSLAAVFTLYSSMASADDFQTIEKHWNEKSPESQYRFSHEAVAAQMAFGIESENGRKLTILKTTQLGPDLIGAKVTYDDVPMLWVIRTDASGQWVGWWQKEYKPVVIGGMEQGTLLDAGTTALAISQGLMEGNPFGLGGAVLITGVQLAASRTVGFDSCLQMRAANDVIHTGASAANLASLAAHLLTAKVTLGVSLLVGLGVAVVRYDAAVEAALWECTGFALS